MNPDEYRAVYRLEEDHWWYAGMRRIAAALLASSGLPSVERVLDAGCGTGYNLAWLRGLCGREVAGLDLYPEALRFSSLRGERLLARGSMAALPYRDASFDLVTAFDSLSHVAEASGRERSVAEFHRVLKRRGVLFVRVAAFEWLRTSHDDEILTRRRYGAGELGRSLRAAGFEIVRLTFANTLLFPLAVAWRALKRLGLAPQGSDVRPNTRGPDWSNRALQEMLRLEAAALRGPSVSFPVGLSVIALARKP